MFRTPLFLALILSATPASSEEPADFVGVEATAPSRPGPLLVEALIERADAQGRERKELAELAWGHAQLEQALARLPGVLPRLEGLEPPPGLAGSMEAEAHWSVALRIEGERATLEVCDPECASWTASWSSERPEQTVDSLVASLAAERSLPYTTGELKGPTDPYIRTIASRATAVTQGLSEPPSRRGDIRTDPIARSVYLDASQPITQWQAARAGVHTPLEVLGLLRRGADDHDDPVFHAAAAWALEQAGAAEPAAEKWLQVMQMAPDDRRFALQAARAAIRVGDRKTAEHCITLLGGDNADAARMRVELADVAGGASDSLLGEWQALDPTNPAPVRRRIRDRLAAGDLAGARTLLTALHERGDAEHARTLGLAIAVNLADLDTARALALESGVELPTADAPTLASVDDQLERVREQAGRALHHAESLARVQNRWSREHAQHYRQRCSDEALDLRDQARTTGTHLREEVLVARAEMEALQLVLASPTVAPVLDPTRRAVAQRLNHDVQHAGHAFLSAVQFQQDQLEWRSRFCG